MIAEHAECSSAKSTQRDGLPDRAFESERIPSGDSAGEGRRPYIYPRPPPSPPSIPKAFPPRPPKRLARHPETRPGPACCRKLTGPNGVSSATPFT
ncbi:MAG: hypothetical protein BJ554DRAFT_896 [Olpidium bornovanus]|uniref:Uncharacterized protein n=1 Tax=Olpidium bornovanus TaxID=278681 RepID=A0A8H7ZTB4_9FUNG|nr:MAG: hypothetical protein BJ554DRAFT_896 [Olpidium bornovanus]